MITHWKAAAILAAAGLGLSAAPAQAEYIDKGYLKFENRAETKRKFCVFAKEQWKLLPRKCFTLEPKEWVVWKRAKPDESFRVAIYEVRRGPDKLLRTSNLLKKETVYIASSSPNGWTQSSWKPRPGPPRPEYRVKFCNVTQAEPVWLTIATAGGKTSMTEGYWSIAQGECKTINYTERFIRNGGGRPDGPLMIMYRAYTTGENRQVWEGSEEEKSPNLCVNTQKQFSLNLWKNGTMESGEFYPCDGENERERRFKLGPELDADAQVGLVNF